MVTSAASVEWTVVNTEVEALQLEYSWIKEFDPRFNVKYRDDKSYPWLAVTLNEEFPRVMVGRGAKKRGVRYFGPYSHAWAIRETVDLLLRVFPMRSCCNGVFKRSAQIGRPCLLGYIGKCSAPCVGRVTRRGAPRDRRRLLRLHGRADRRRSSSASRRRCTPRPPTHGLRAGRPAARRHRRPQAGDGEAARWCSATAPTPTWSRSPRTRSRPPCRSSTSAAAGSAASAAGSPTRSRTPTPAAWSSASSSSCTTAEIGDSIPREVLVPALPEDTAGRSSSG